MLHKQQQDATAGLVNESAANEQWQLEVLEQVPIISDGKDNLGSITVRVVRGR